MLPHIRVWRSVRTGGDTKTRNSRRTLALPRRCVEALREHRDRQATDRAAAGADWTDHDLVFATRTGRPLDAANVRRDFRRIATAAGLHATDWTPRELRHSFVSLLSDEGVPDRADRPPCRPRGRLVRHRDRLPQAARPVIDEGAIAMDRIFDTRRVSHSVVTQPASESRTARSRTSLEVPDQAVCWWAILGLNQ